MCFTAAPAAAHYTASAVDDDTSRPTVELQVCNKSGRNATVAISYVEVGGQTFTNRGWFNVNNGSCETIATTDNENFYFYAEAIDGSELVWQGSHTLCVAYPGPYTFVSDDSDTCASWQEVRGFVVAKATEPGTYTWTLNP